MIRNVITQDIRCIGNDDSQTSRFIYRNVVRAAAGANYGTTALSR